MFDAILCIYSQLPFYTTHYYIILYAQHTVLMAMRNITIIIIPSKQTYSQKIKKNTEKFITANVVIMIMFMSKVC